jgi:hypothetical protein
MPNFLDLILALKKIIASISKKNLNEILNIPKIIDAINDSIDQAARSILESQELKTFFERTKSMIDALKKEADELKRNTDEILKEASNYRPDLIEEATIINDIVKSGHYGFSEIDAIKDKINKLNQEISQAKASQQSLVKCSLNVQKQFFGKRQGVVNRIVDEERNKAENQDPRGCQSTEKIIVNVESFGLSLTLREYNALFALQALLTKHGYKENRLVFTPSEYLEAYGLKRKTTGREKQEFFGVERQSAIQALRSLAEKRVFLWYQIPTGKKENGKMLFNTKYEENASILRIIVCCGDLTNEEGEKVVAQKKARHFEVEFHPIIFQGIDNYFCLKNQNFYNDVRKILGNKNDKTVCLFLEKLMEQAFHKIRNNNEKLYFEVTLGELAIQLRLEKAVHARQWKRIHESIEKSISIAKQLGMLVKIEKNQSQAGETKFCFTLNQDFFHLPIIENQNQ